MRFEGEFWIYHQYILGFSWKLQFLEFKKNLKKAFDFVNSLCGFSYSQVLKDASDFFASYFSEVSQTFAEYLFCRFF